MHMAFKACEELGREKDESNRKEVTSAGSLHPPFTLTPTDPLLLWLPHATDTDAVTISGHSGPAPAPDDEDPRDTDAQ